MSPGQCGAGSDRSDCPVCEGGGLVMETPEAGYATCVECGERGYWRDDGTEWWRNDPDSMWYVESGSDQEVDEWPCHCQGENADWRYHSEEGCAATGQAFAFVGGGRRFYADSDQEVDD